MGDGAEGDKAARLPKTSHFLFPFPIPSLALAGPSANTLKSSLLQAAVKLQLLTELTKHCSKAATASSLL